MADNLDVLVSQVQEMLPATGQTVEFDALKASVLESNPTGGIEQFRAFLKRGEFSRRLVRKEDGSLVTILSRKS